MTAGSRQLLRCFSLMGTEKLCFHRLPHPGHALSWFPTGGDLLRGRASTQLQCNVDPRAETSQGDSVTQVSL